MDALATVPRERFLRPGPWTVLADTDFTIGAAGRMRTTPDADPRRVSHNIAVAIDPARHLFNGQPGTLTVWIDALALAPGARVLHVGCGLGYYTAVMAQVVGPQGRIVAYEVDAALAAEARQNLAAMPWVSVRHADASGRLDETFNAMLINAGVTHPLNEWLDRLESGGRLMLPLTGTMPAIGANIGKGLVWQLTKQDGYFDARVLAFVAIYSAIGLRDETLNERLGKAMMAGPAQWQGVKRLRRDRHEPGSSCWLHGDGFCFSREN